MNYVSVQQAQACILEHARTCASIPVHLFDSLGKVLAEDVYANRNHPPYDVSAMDGYAVRSDDILAAAPGRPVHLQMIEDIRAGEMPRSRVLRGRCSRIMTGAPVPSGADTVIRAEDTELDGDSVSILAPQQKGSNVRRMGENLRDGHVVLNAGAAITPGVFAILSMVKKKDVMVYGHPRVAILSTGDELEGLDEPVDENKIPDANSYALMAQCRALGIEPTLLGIARDNPIEIRAKISEGLKYDALLASGGVSVGHHDFIRPMLEDLGVTIHFWRVSMRPGHPVAFGTSNGGGLVFGLPGNPVSSMVCFEQFAAPALRSMMGHRDLFRSTIAARLTEDFRDRTGRMHFVRVTLSRKDGGYLATPTGTQGSGILMSMAQAQGLMVISEQREGVQAGDMVIVQLLHDSLFQAEAGLEA
jgi:molybdopterin molybdotransferase